jgi:hypothetical protein
LCHSRIASEFDQQCQLAWLEFRVAAVDARFRRTFVDFEPAEVQRTIRR